MKFIHCRYWFAPVGISLGIKNTKPKKAPPNAILEGAYLSKRKMKHKEVSTLFLRMENESEVHVR
jgi:ceramide synthetase